MIDLLYISYSYHDRAQRPRGLVPALAGRGFRPIVIHRPQSSGETSEGRRSEETRGAVLVPAPEPGYDAVRRLSRFMRGAGRIAAARQVREGGGAESKPVRADENRLGSSRQELPLREVPRWIQELTAFPDRNALWIGPATEAGLEAARRWRPRLVYASGWPISSLAAGRRLAVALGLPLVLELRDLWVENPFLEYTFSLRKRLDRNWEGRLLRAADAIIVVTEPMRETLLRTHPQLDPARVHVVPNGFDPAVIKSPAGAGKAGHPPRLVYTGHLYGRRSPLPLLEALGRLREERGAPPCRLRLIGRVSPGFLPALAQGEREGWVERAGVVSYADSLCEIEQADGLLLLIENSRGAEGIMTGKIFPYLASGRPILALVPPAGVAADLVRRAEAGLVVDPDDVPAISGALRTWLDGSLKVSSLEERQGLLHSHSWPILAGKVAEILGEVLERHGRPAPAARKGH